MVYTLTEDKGVELPQTGAWTLVRIKDAKRQRVCISGPGIVVRVFSSACGVASRLFCASYACSAFRTFDFVNASGPTFRYFSLSARSAFSADKLGQVAATTSGV